MLEQADTVHRLTPPEDALSAADAAIAAVGVGSEAAPVVAKTSTPPSALGVSMELLRRGLLDNGYGELPVGSEHAVALDGLPPIHKDPFGRLLVAQALVEQGSAVLCRSR